MHQYADTSELLEANRKVFADGFEISISSLDFQLRETLDKANEEKIKRDDEINRLSNMLSALEMVKHFG